MLTYDPLRGLNCALFPKQMKNAFDLFLEGKINAQEM